MRFLPKKELQNCCDCFVTVKFQFGNSAKSYVQFFFSRGANRLHVRCSWGKKIKTSCFWCTLTGIVVMKRSIFFHYCTGGLNLDLVVGDPEGCIREGGGKVINGFFLPLLEESPWANVTMSCFNKAGENGPPMVNLSQCQLRNVPLNKSC